jgi:5-hydroxyisourate hydrolase
MGRLTTHVLDTSRGMPAAMMSIQVFKLINGADQQKALIKSVATNSDGRCDASLLEGVEFSVGTYELQFDVGSYFKRISESQSGAAVPEPTFLGTVPIRFIIADPSVHYHVPLLVSPWSYSTYRGS